ncbi:uncharacterized protein MELLADRAFT_109197 [Melampsora larici-populina 98AG31]|uniref:Secreted protein n=1 Tax=Melampsora larici-populina (strain 98AG31 / pathotype 3-4-7) TaxID=747676 RepID=F4RVP5_MELLP|nr:uncharacterized protein MELLADRAFT_109197 [Melampsora larici-populina 98AG31]EGG03393.1 secreted protein [Melampsora larici-populina 98AG31]
MKYHMIFVGAISLLNYQAYGLLHELVAPPLPQNFQVIDKGVEGLNAHIKPLPGMEKMQADFDLNQQLQRQTINYQFNPKESDVQFGPFGSETDEVDGGTLHISGPTTSVAAPEIAPEAIAEPIRSAWVAARRFRGCSRKPPQGEVPPAVKGRLAWFFNGGINGC